MPVGVRPSAQSFSVDMAKFTIAESGKPLVSAQIVVVKWAHETARNVRGVGLGIIDGVLR